MKHTLRISQWNANGLSDKRQEMEVFLRINKVDIMLISESRFTDKNYFKISGYSCYFTNHPSGNAQGGTGVLVKNTLKHYPLQQFQTDHLQATSVVIEDTRGCLTISATYCPPRHSPKTEHFNEYFSSLGAKFVSGGNK